MIISDLLAEMNFLDKDYEETPRNKRRWDSSQPPKQTTPSGYLQSSNSSLNPSMEPTSAANQNQPDPCLHAVSSISDWDLLLFQMGHAQPTIGATISPTNFSQLPVHINGDPGTTADLSNTMGQNEQLPEFLMSERDLFSLWSDIPCAFKWVSFFVPRSNFKHAVQWRGAGRIPRGRCKWFISIVLIHCFNPPSCCLTTWKLSC